MIPRLALLAIILVNAAVLTACPTATMLERPMLYGEELQECTRKSETLTASLDCEDGVRARYDRPKLVRDGGPDGNH